MLLHADVPLGGLGKSVAVIGLTAAGLIYTAGWRREKRGRFATRQLGAFLGGLACLGVAIASPLDETADVWLSAHMVQHILLLTVAPVLLLLGQPLLPLLRGLPDLLRRSIVAPLFRLLPFRA